MSCIHFKFKSSLEFEKVSFDGLQLSLAELRDAIMKSKGIGSANQYTFKVTDAQTKREYKNDDEMIPRNSSVVVSRVPLINAPKIPKTQLPDPSLPQPASISSLVRSSTGGIPSTSLPALTSSTAETSQQPLSVEELVKKPDLSSGNASEETRMMAMMHQAADGYNPSQYVKFSGPRRGGGHSMGGVVNTKPPPPNYKCYRCGQPGHYINVCPTNGDPKYDNYRYKPVKGTPASQLISVQGGVPEAMLDRHGNLVVRAADFQALIKAQNKGKKPSESPRDLELPPELKCHLCEQLVRDAVIIPCCGESFCYECIQESLCDNDFTCPMCKAENVSPEKLAPNKALRTAAKKFQLKVNELKSEAVARGFVKQVPPPVVQVTPPATKPPVSQPPPVLVKPPSPEASQTSTSSQPLSSASVDKDGPSVEAQSVPAPVSVSNGLAGLSSTGSVPVVKNEALAGLLNSAVLGGSSVLAMLPQNSKDLLAADLLLSGAKKSPSPPPMTPEEFYRQQKLLKLLAKKTVGSRPSSPDSHSSWSDSDTSSSDSRSRSPIKRKHKSRKSHKHSSRKRDLEKHHSSHRRRREEKRRRGLSKSPDRKRAGEKHKRSSKRKHRTEDLPRPQETKPVEVLTEQPPIDSGDILISNNSQVVNIDNIVSTSSQVEDVVVKPVGADREDDCDPVDETDLQSGDTNKDDCSSVEVADEDLCVDLHVEGSLDGLDSELAEVTTPTADTGLPAQLGKEEGEISDSGQSEPLSPPTQRTVSSSDQSAPLAVSGDQQEDLRIEIERAREKRKLESSQSDELDSIKPPMKVAKVILRPEKRSPSKVVPIEGKPLVKSSPLIVRRSKPHKKPRKVSYSSDSSVSSSEASEIERRKSHKSRHKSSSKKPEKRKHKSKEKKLKKSKSHSSRESRSHVNNGRDSHQHGSKVKKAKKSSKH